VTRRLHARYTIDMTIEQLRRLHRATPFQPFDIHLADGHSLPVDHPEVLGITPPGRTIFVALANGEFEIVEPPLITSLRIRPTSQKSRRKPRA
jgi:hypothetical protein